MQHCTRLGTGSNVQDSPTGERKSTDGQHVAVDYGGLTMTTAEQQELEALVAEVTVSKRQDHELADETDFDTLGQRLGYDPDEVRQVYWRVVVREWFADAIEPWGTDGPPIPAVDPDPAVTEAEQQIRRGAVALSAAQQAVEIVSGDYRRLASAAVARFGEGATTLLVRAKWLVLQTVCEEAERQAAALTEALIRYALALAEARQAAPAQAEAEREGGV